MARTVRDTSLESKAARRRLIPRGKPYFRALEPGLHIGYRRLAKGSGKWVARHYVGEQKYVVEVISVADDLSDADGVAILDFAQAQTLARAQMVARAKHAAGHIGPVTVADAVRDYVQFLEAERKSAVDAQYRADAYILPALGNIEVEKLTTDRIRKWLLAIATSPARLRTKPGREQRYREHSSDEEAIRKRRSTANRNLTVLKAALNRQWREERVSTDRAWRRVQPFREVDAARIRYLNVKEAQKLIDASEPSFRALVIAALQTGARYGEIIKLEVADFIADVGTVAIRKSKSSKPRHVVLTDEGRRFFQTLVEGRASSDRLFVKEDGSFWKTSHQNRPMKQACIDAGLAPIGFHGLRHTWASLAVMAGVPLLVVAKNLGHSDTRMVERHYGHLEHSFIADEIRRGAPQFERSAPLALQQVTA